MGRWGRKRHALALSRWLPLERRREGEGRAGHAFAQVADLPDGAVSGSGLGAQLVALLATWYANSSRGTPFPAPKGASVEIDRLVTLIGDALGPAISSRQLSNS